MTKIDIDSIAKLRWLTYLRYGYRISSRTVQVIPVHTERRKTQREKYFSIYRGRQDENDILSRGRMGFLRLPRTSVAFNLALLRLGFITFGNLGFMRVGRERLIYVHAVRCFISVSQ